MPKKSNRETVRLGHVHERHVTRIKAPGVDVTIQRIEVGGDDPDTFARKLAAECDAANAAADRKDIVAASGLYGVMVCPECNGSTQTGYVCPTCKNAQVVPRSADPGDIVGLDGFTPGGDTPKHGDPERTDPDAD